MSGMMYAVFGVKVPPKKSVELVPAVDEDMEGFEIMHLTRVALGEKPAAGPHTVFITCNDDEKIAVGTLDAERCPQFGVDYTVSIQGLTLSNNGPSPVYVSGYKTYATLSDGEEESEEEEYDSEDEELAAANGLVGSSSEEEDEDLPKAVPIRGAEDVSTSNEEDEEDGEDGEDTSDLEDEEEDEEEAAAMMEEDDSELDEFDESAEDEESESEEEEEEEIVQAPAKKAKKAVAAVTPAAGKGKTAGAATPGTLATTPGSTGDYIAALKQALRSHGPTVMAQLGSLVKRPANAPKLKVVLDKNPTLFNHDLKTGMVSLR